MLLAMGIGFTACNDDDNDYTVATGDAIRSITTNDPSDITATSAILTGKAEIPGRLSASSYTAGIIYSTTEEGVATGIKQAGSIDADGNISATLTGLESGKTYYYAAYVSLQKRVDVVGDIHQFAATDATLTTLQVTSSAISSCKAMLNGQALQLENDLDKVSIGFKIARTSEGVEDGTEVMLEEDSCGVYYCQATNLRPSTTYYYAAYIGRNDGKEEYGEVLNFTTTDQAMEYVDLGLSMLWASCNVGAENPEEAGIVCNYTDANAALTEINIDADETYTSSVPSWSDIKELVSKTTQKAETLNGVAGIRFTASNGNSIFVPAASYWSNELTAYNTAYGRTLLAGTEKAEECTSEVESLLALRTVAVEVPGEGLTLRRSRIAQGDIENNGNYRVDLYNAWDGNGKCMTSETSAIPFDEVVFENNIRVVFTIKGVPEGSQIKAFMCFADGTWKTQNWGYNEEGEGSVLVTGDGKYEMNLHADTVSSGLGVFAIDFPGLSTAAGGAQNVNVHIDNIFVDDEAIDGIKVNNNNLVCGDLEKNGNFRLELYNEYGSTAKKPVINPDDVDFYDNISVTFKIEGITSTDEFQTKLSFADSDWSLQNWNYNADGNGSCIVKGDGTYTLTLKGEGIGLKVCTVDILGLATAEGSTSNLKAKIVSVCNDKGISKGSVEKSNLVCGDIEKNGNFRIDIYNPWDGSKTDSLPAVDPSTINFAKNISFTFKIEGIQSTDEFQTKLTFADASWKTSNWDYHADGTGSCIVKGDGTYTLTMPGYGYGFGVCAIDIIGLAAAEGSTSNLKAELVRVVNDEGYKNVTVNNDNLVCGDIEKKGNLRIDLYNAWDGSKTDSLPALTTSEVVFNEEICVMFDVNGISADNTAEYKAQMTFADGTWKTQNWNYNEDGTGSCIVKGNGTYTMALKGAGSGVGVFAIDIAGLVSGESTPANLSASIRKIVVK